MVIHNRDFGYLSQFIRDVDALARSVVEQYQAFPEVVAIYQRVIGEEVTFWVFAEMETYDEDLMNRLIEVELRLFNEFEHIDQDIYYSPAALEDRQRDIVGNDALHIYQRQ